LHLNNIIHLEFKQSDTALRHKRIIKINTIITMFNLSHRTEHKFSQHDQLVGLCRSVYTSYCH